MESQFITERLTLLPLTLADDAFILELVNTPGWLRFIGDRNVHSTEDAQAYINRINSTTFKYWVVTLNDELKSIGIITFIKRDYLDFPDLGFAFLPDYTKAGYAYEAALTIRNYLLESGLAEKLLATTIPDNVASIALLNKLGFTFKEDIENSGTKLSLYEHQQ